MKAKFSHVIAKSGKQSGSTYYVFISQGISSKAVTVFQNVSCIGCDSIDDLAAVVGSLKPGDSLEIDFVPDQSNNIAVAIVC